MLTGRLPRRMGSAKIRRFKAEDVASIAGGEDRTSELCREALRRSLEEDASLRATATALLETLRQ